MAVGVAHASHRQSRLEDHVCDVHVCRDVHDVQDNDMIRPRSHNHNDVGARVEELMHYSQELTHLLINPDCRLRCNTIKRAFKTNCA